MKLVAVEKWEIDKSPVGVELRYAIVDGAAYATTRYWREALAFPVEAQFTFHIESACRKIEGRGKVARVQDRSGDILIRWAAVKEALRGVDHKYHSKKLPPCVVGGLDQWFRWMERYEDLLWWGAELEEQALAATARVSVATTAEEHLLAAQVLLGRQVNEHGEIIAQQQQLLVVHDSEIKTIKDRLLRDPNENVSARTWCGDRVDPSACPIAGDKRNWEELLGVVCKKLCFEPGPKINTRLSGNALLREVNTWRRMDLEAAYAEITRVAAERSTGRA